MFLFRELLEQVGRVGIVVDGAGGEHFTICLEAAAGFAVGDEAVVQVEKRKFFGFCDGWHGCDLGSKSRLKRAEIAYF